MATKDHLPPIHPGEILQEEFLDPLGMSAHQLAIALRVPATRVNDILKRKRGITVDTAALRLSWYFGTTSRFWMNLQTAYELESAEDEVGNTICARCCREQRREFRHGAGTISPVITPAST